jgi:hypothetical protein
MGTTVDAPRTYAFGARDRIDETENRIRSVRDARYHYLRNYRPMPGQPNAGQPNPGFLSLNRYKEKCFAVKPLMRQLAAEGKLTGAAADLMQPLPDEQLFDTQADAHEINNLATSNKPEHQAALLRLRAALDTWISETGDRGEFLEPREVFAPFEKEMHDWFGTPDWYSK